MFGSTLKQIFFTVGGSKVFQNATETIIVANTEMTSEVNKMWIFEDFHEIDVYSAGDESARAPSVIMRNQNKDQFQKK